jgi:hypothetical protein
MSWHCRRLIGLCGSGDYKLESWADAVEDREKFDVRKRNMHGDCRALVFQGISPDYMLMMRGTREIIQIQEKWCSNHDGSSLAVATAAQPQSS